MLIHHNLFTIATLSNGAINVSGVVGTHEAIAAVLLLVGFAFFTFTAGIDQAAHSHAIANFPAGHLGPHCRDYTSDFVPNCKREVGFSPLVADGVNVAVTNASSLDVNDHIFGAGVTAFKIGNHKRFIKSEFLKCFDSKGHDKQAYVHNTHTA